MGKMLTTITEEITKGLTKLQKKRFNTVI